MRYRSILWLTLIAFLACGGGAMAQQQRRGGDQGQARGQRGGQGGRGQGGGGLFRVLDADRDGNLSKQEIDGAAAVLMKLDADRNGVLDEKELEVRGGQRGKQGSRGDGDTGRQREMKNDVPPAGKNASGSRQGIRKPRIEDTIRANVYADNSFRLYINGELVAVDSIRFVPHNVVSVDVLPAYPMTIAVMGIDNADPDTGMEYANTNIGDGGLILKLGDGTVTSASWKVKAISTGPIGGDTENPRVESVPVPKDWYAVDYDDRDWPNAREFSEEEVGPKEPYYDHDFSGAKFIWSNDVKLDNLVLFRTVVNAPPDGKPRPDFRGLTDVVPQRPQRGGGGGRPRN